MKSAEAEGHAMTLWVFYCGTVFAGRSTTLQALGRILCPPPPSWRTAAARWRAAVPSGDHVVISAEPETSLANLGLAEVVHEPVFAGLDESLRRADAIVFVADSQACRATANRSLLDRLRNDLRLVDRDLDDVPIVFQLNKRDLDGISSLETLRRELRAKRSLYVESVAKTGAGVLEALEAAIRLVRDEAP